MYPAITLVFVVGLAVRVALLPLASGVDFKIWDLTVTALLHGQDTYSHTPLPLKSVGPYAYFPLYLYLLAPLKLLALHTGWSYTILGKLPVVAGDVGVALAIATILGRAGCSERARAAGIALFFLNPLVLYNGAFYGRFDSLPLALLLLAWLHLSRAHDGDGRDHHGSRNSRGGIGLAVPYALAVTLKTFPIFLLPYVLARVGRRRGVRVALAALLLPLVVSLPYLLHDARRFLYIVFIYDSAKGPRQFSWQVALLDLGVSERTATIVSYGLLALFALMLIVPPAGRKAKRDSYAYTAVAYTLFLLLSKVVYEQYLLWPLPFLIILAVRDRARDALLLLSVLSVTGVLANEWIHPFGYKPYPALWLNGLIAIAAALFVLSRLRSRWAR